MKKVIIAITLAFFFISAYSQPCLPEGIIFETQQQINNFQTNYPDCTEIEGDVQIGQNAPSDEITNLNGLSILTSISGNLVIRLNNHLTSLTGLDNLTSIGGDLTISFNGLTDLNGLGNLIIIEGDLSVYYNYLLSNLAGLDNLTSIGGDLYLNNLESMESLLGLQSLTSIGEGIMISENPALTSLTGLNKLASIGEGIHISYNDVLTNLTGLNNIDASTINWLSILANPKLSSCEAKSICDYLINSTGYVEISSNAPGCNSQAEVEEDCEDLSVQEHCSDNKLSFYPNPANQRLNISADGLSIYELVIYTLTGQQVFPIRPKSSTIDISTLQPGMYIVEVLVEGKKVRQKLLVHR
jgi:hypothetical protein